MEVVITVVIVIAVLAVLIVPVLLRGFSGTTDLSDVSAARDIVAVDSVEDEVARYRVALRANTLCGRCGQANPADAKFCYECGRRLPVLDAEEFEGTETA